MSSPKLFLKKILTSKIMQLIGILGYSIYLLHWFVLRVVNTIYPMSTSQTFIVVTIGSILISSLSFCYIEYPFIKYSHKKQ
jgi:peptidoglycan/LPS O-acetylase OafA/YrhL